MPENWDDVNIGNPCNSRRDTEPRNDAKVTHADHPVSENVGGVRQKPKHDDVFDEPTAEQRNNPNEGKNKDDRGRSNGGSSDSTPVAPAAATPPPVPPKAGHIDFDIHAETVRDPGVDMPGETTSHADPLSGETGMHPVGVGVGAAAGGAAAGAVVGIAAGAVAGPLGAAIGAAVGTTLGAIGGGYTGKHIAEKVNPTTEDHYWRHAFVNREYVPKGAKYEDWEPAYEYGIEMREWLIDKTWEEAEEMIRAGWMESEAGKALPWDRAKPAIQDAWDHLTPEPGEPEVTEDEKLADD